MNASEVFEGLRGKISLIEVGQRIREAVINSGMTKREVARRMGTHYDALNRYYKGERSIPVDALIALCVVTGVQPNWVVMGYGPMKLPEDVEIIEEG